MRTLYISDLDGTLLRGNRTLSSFTCEAIRALTARGVLFSYATARSLYTATTVTGGLTTSLPVVLHNGVFTVQPETGHILRSCAFSAEDVATIRTAADHLGVTPIVYTMTEAGERYSLMPERLTEGGRAYLAMHEGDPRGRVTDSAEALWQGHALFNILCIDSEEKLSALYGQFRHTYRCVYQREMYSGYWWLEIFPRCATKADGVLDLKQRLACDRLVCFGDGVNDLPLFAVADECYAVANAEQEVKAAATAVIGSNEEDGVTRWLLAHAL